MNWRAFAYRQSCRMRGDPVPEILDELRASERWSPDQLREAQEARLRALLLHAFENVPYYREPLLASGGVVDGKAPCVNLDRFGHLPPLSRAVVQRRAPELRERPTPRGGDGEEVVFSGGTTGIPVRVIRDRATHRSVVAVQLWFDEWTGYTFGQPTLLVTGRHRRTLGLGERVRNRVREYLKNELRLQHFVLSDRVLDRYIDRINRARPVRIVGWAGVVGAVAGRAERAGRTIAPPRAVMVSAEPLLPGMRVQIERVFRAPVFNRYGCNEVGGIACECGERNGLHVSSLTHYVEVLRPDGAPAEPGEIGEIVLTHLANYRMPLIRYRIGDLGAWAEGACPCGRPFPRVRDLVGRTLDAFVGLDGTLVHGMYVWRFYQRVPWIERFQVIQLTRERVHVKLVDRERAADPFRARREALAVITTHLRQALGERCTVTFEFVEEILVEPSGKHRPTLSLVPRP